MFSGSCGRWLVDTIAEDDIIFKKPGMPCDYRWNSIIINNVYQYSYSNFITSCEGKAYSVDCKAWSTNALKSH